MEICQRNGIGRVNPKRFVEPCEVLEDLFSGLNHFPGDDAFAVLRGEVETGQNSTTGEAAQARPQKAIVAFDIQSSTVIV